MSKIYPQLRFNEEKCKEALEFYKKCLDGKVTFLQTLGESPMAKDMPKETHNRVMHAMFEAGDIKFVASDMMRDKAKSGDQVSIMVECDSKEQLEEFFRKMSEGGEVFMKPEEQFWGAVFGMLTDKYGIEWSFNYMLEKKK